MLKNGMWSSSVWFFFVKIVFDSISNPCTKLSLDLRCEWIMISIENALTSRTWYTFILDWWQLLVLPRFIQWECTKAKLKKERIHTWSVCLRLLGAWEHDNCLECIDVRTWYHDLYDDTKHAHTLFCSLGGALSLAFFFISFQRFCVDILNVFAWYRTLENPLRIVRYYVYQMSNHQALCKDNMHRCSTAKYQHF